jgi:outer membrane protein TolC
MRTCWRRFVLGTLLLALGRPTSGQGPSVVADRQTTLPPPRPAAAAVEVSLPPVPVAPVTCLGPPADLTLSLSPGGNALRAEAPAHGDVPLPINLATALRLADARPVVIAAAQASVKQALAQLDQAQVLWLPNLYLGAAYYRHDGGGQGNSGTEFINGRDQFLAGYGLTAIVSTADAVFEPLARKQTLRAREIEVQTARNDALLEVAEAYFNVQQARGRLAGARDAVDKGEELVQKIRRLGRELTPPVEADRARAELAELKKAMIAAYEDWRVASAELTRVLRLNPGAVVAPMEPPHLQVTLLPPEDTVDHLIPVGLTNRPELASQQALVQATLVRLRQEKLRPLMPSVVLLGNPVPAAPGGYLMGGAFVSTASGQTNPWTARNDTSVQLLWELRNLGCGNHALVREREADQLRAVVELARVEDRVAAEVAQAHARLQSATLRFRQAETGLREAQTTYRGNILGLGETTRSGDLLVLIYRPQEVVAALRQLLRSYGDYFDSINDYNRAQFRLYRALGYPAGILACERSPGSIVPVDTTRPPQMMPVHAPEPCTCPH